MNKQQRRVAYDCAEAYYKNLEFELDASVVDGGGFDEVEDGVWVHAWVKVPKHAIPGYVMTPPAPPSSVTIISDVGDGKWPFKLNDHPHLNNNQSDN